MKRSVPFTFWIFFLFFSFLSADDLCHAQSGAVQSIDTKTEKSAPVPDLAEIIPLASELAGKRARLENELQALPDVSAVEQEFAAFKTEVDDVTVRLQKIKDSEDIRWAQLAGLSQELQEMLTLSTEVGKPLARRINFLATSQREWQTEQNKWQEWESRLLTDHAPLQIKATFTGAGETIDGALSLILQQLDGLLQFQAEGSAVRTRIEVLNSEIKLLISSGLRKYLFTASPPMYSPEFFSQFQRELWRTALENIGTLSLPSRRFVVQHAWTLIAELLLFLAVLFSIHRNREVLLASERWHFLAARPFASGFFMVSLTQLLFPEHQLWPLAFRLVITLVGGISMARILLCLVEVSWKRQASIGVIVLYILTSLIVAISIPLPLYRLYTFLASLLSLFFLVRWAGESARLQGSPLFAWMFRVGYILIGIIMFTQLQGKEGLAAYLFDSTLTSLTLLLAFALFIYMIRGGLHWLFFSSPVWNIKQLRSEAEFLARRSGYLVEAFVIGLILLPALLTAWNAYRSMPEAINGLLAFGFDLGSQRISIALVLAAAGTLYGSLLLSWITPKVVLDEKVAGANLERGVRISIGRLIQYFIIFIGFLMTISVIGFDLTKITIMVSALGVGIGFGLQGLVNNFISGLVLLFEQPVRVGDTIEIGGKWTEIKRIGLRSTTVQTLEKADVIIPNGDLISKEVTNWTLSNRQIRVSVPVGVAYGSDVPKVMETLLASANDHEMVIKSPPPQVLFLRFGESSLDFELRTWITDADNRLQVISELHQEIDRRFREAKIEIAFPQRDLHLRSVDKSVLGRHASQDVENEEVASVKDCNE